MVRVSEAPKDLKIYIDILTRTFVLTNHKIRSPLTYGLLFISLSNATISISCLEQTI